MSGGGCYWAVMEAAAGELMNRECGRAGARAVRARLLWWIRRVGNLFVVLVKRSDVAELWGNGAGVEVAWGSFL